MKAFKILSLDSDGDQLRDRLFWQTHTPDQRVAAMEILRHQWYKLRNERPQRLRRILRIIKSTKD